MMTMVEGSDRKRKRKKLIQTTRRKRTSNPLAWIWLLVAMMAGAIMNMFVTIYEVLLTRNRAVSLPADTAVDDDDHPNIYERGGPPPRRPRTYDQWGYDHRPTLERLLRDLSLPGRLGRSAADALLARIETPETRVWAAHCIEDNAYRELRRAKSSCSSEAAILSTWDRYAREYVLALVDDDPAISDPGADLKPKF